MPQFTYKNANYKDSTYFTGVLYNELLNVNRLEQ